MRSLVVSTLCMVFIIAGWAYFTNHTDSVINEMIYIIDNQIDTSVSEKDWDEAGEAVSQLSSFWDKHKDEYMLFYDHAALSNIDITISKAVAYLCSRSDDQTLGEVAALRKQLQLLHKSESLKWGNII